MRRFVFLASTMGIFLLLASVALAHGGQYTGPAGGGSSGGFAPAGGGTPGPGPGPAGGGTTGGGGPAGGRSLGGSADAVARRATAGHASAVAHHDRGEEHDDPWSHDGHSFPCCHRQRQK